MRGTIKRIKPMKPKKFAIVPAVFGPKTLGVWVSPERTIYALGFGFFMLVYIPAGYVWAKE